MFQTMHWFAAERIVEDLKDMTRQGSRCPESLIRGVRALATALKSWALTKDVIYCLEVSFSNGLLNSFDFLFRPTKAVMKIFHTALLYPNF